MFGFFPLLPAAFRCGDRRICGLRLRLARTVPRASPARAHGEKCRRHTGKKRCALRKFPMVFSNLRVLSCKIACARSKFVEEKIEMSRRAEEICLREN